MSSRFRHSNCWDIKQIAKGENMSLKKITTKEWTKKGLPTSVTYIHIGPYYQLDNIKKNFKKPILMFTNELHPKKKK